MNGEYTILCFLISAFLEFSFAFNSKLIYSKYYHYYTQSHVTHTSSTYDKKKNVTSDF